MNTRAFTLVEMLVVIAVIAILAATTLGMVGARSTRQVDVTAAAEELAANLRRARATAMAQHRVIGVAFHIQNGVGTSGRILNNRDGGHYYRLISTPPPVLGDGNYYKTRDTVQFPDILESIEESWMTPPIALPKGRVRFLALGDTDEGDYQSAKNDVSTYQNDAYYRPYSATWPRPWFGVWTGGRLHAWGGYDPDDAQTRWFAGFFYQGTPRQRANGGVLKGGVYGTPSNVDATLWGDFWGIFPSGGGTPTASGPTGWGTAADEDLTRNPVVRNSVNPDDRTTWYYPEVHIDGFARITPPVSNETTPPTVPTATSDDPANAGYCYVDGFFSRERWKRMPPAVRPSQVAYTLWRKDRPRPLVDSAMLDAVILFTPDGNARFLEWNTYRRGWDWAMPLINTAVTPHEIKSTARGGVADRAKPRGRDMIYASLIDPENTGTDPEVRHYDRVTGGYFVTLAPDAEIVDGDARSSFATPQEALRSITPACRVFVSSFGEVSVVPVRATSDEEVGDAAYWNTKMWPSAPTAWATASEIRKHVPLGILAPGTGTKGPWTPNQLFGVRRPASPGGRVEPITDLVTPRMLTGQVWWRNE